MNKWVEEHMGWIIAIVCLLVMILIGYYIFDTLVYHIGDDPQNVTCFGTLGL
jgi:hypothetical protein